jgi:hypothetical protein
VTAGILALLCITILCILFFTGWLPGLEQELSVNKRDLFIFLALSFGLTGRSPWNVNLALQIHPGIFVLFILFFIFLKKISLVRLLRLASFSLCTSSLLFFWHEMFRMSADWSHSVFRMVTAVVLPLGAMAVTKALGEKILFLTLSLLSLHFLLLYFHREVLNPILIGEEAFLDTFWLTMSVFILLTDPVPSFVLWIKERCFLRIKQR